MPQAELTTRYSCHHTAWRQHRSEIRRFLEHRVGASDADDLLQEVFLKALLQGENFCDLENPRAWLFQVARNLLLDRHRLTKEQVPLPDDMCAQSSPEIAPVDLMCQCLPRVLNELAVQDREAILSCDMQGMTQSAYAQLHGVSLAAAKSRVLRARMRLREQIALACQVKFDEEGKVCCFQTRPPLEPAC